MEHETSLFLETLFIPWGGASVVGVEVCRRELIHEAFVGGEGLERQSVHRLSGQLASV